MPSGERDRGRGAARGGAARGGRDTRAATNRHSAVPRSAAARRNVPSNPTLLENRKMALEIQLINQIEKHELLYNFNLPEYNRKDMVEDAWANIAANTNMSSKYASWMTSLRRTLRALFGGVIFTIRNAIVTQ